MRPGIVLTPLSCLVRRAHIKLFWFPYIYSGKVLKVLKMLANFQTKMAPQVCVRACVHVCVCACVRVVVVIAVEVLVVMAVVVCAVVLLV